MICDRLPDVAVIDISMPDLNGIDLATQLARSCPQVRILALTVHEDRAYIQPLLKAGARGYLLKRSAAEDLVRAIRAIASGGTYLDPAIADRAISDAARGGRSDSTRLGDPESLSQREDEVLRLTARGYSNKEIAAQLDVSIKTVETYKTRAAEKLGLRTRADIVRYGASHGWLADLEGR
jgi:DNA-binding NarL/FixJ family response regulator